MNHPCSARLIDQALSFALSREAAVDSRSAVLVHGNAHSANILRGPTSTSERPEFRFIDPDGLLAEPACDLAVPMRDWSDELLAGDPVRLGHERCQWLSDLTGVNPQAIWEWGLIGRVSTGLLLTLVDSHQEGRRMLEVGEPGRPGDVEELIQCEARDPPRESLQETRSSSGGIAPSGILQLHPRPAPWPRSTRLNDPGRSESDNTVSMDRRRCEQLAQLRNIGQVGAIRDDVGQLIRSCCRHAVARYPTKFLNEFLVRRRCGGIPRRMHFP